jgi:thiamine-monophosphate kinase
MPPAGLKIMTASARAERRFRVRATGSVTNPTPDLEVGIALADYLTSAMDSSDGLARSLHTLAEESRVGFELDKVPAAEGVARFAKENGVPLQDLVMAGGEEYLIVGTVSPRKLAGAREAACLAGGHLLTIGRATRERAKVFLRKDGSRKQIADQGWTHLG